jgi:hypothetical protein
MAGEQDRMGHSPRFSATVLAKDRDHALAIIFDLGLDRLPDFKGEIRLLIDANDAQRLLERGLQVLLLKSVPVAPLNPKLIYTDAEARAALDKRLKAVRRPDHS